DAQALRQCAHCPHQLLGRHALSMQRGAMGLLEVAATARAMQLSPGAAVGMPVGTYIAQPEPAAIATGGSGTEIARGVPLAAAAACGDDGGWRGTGGLRARRGGVLTQGTGRLVGEACKRLGLLGALTPQHDGRGWGSLCCRASAGPGSVQHAKEPQESQDRQLVEQKVWNHGKTSSLDGETGRFYLILGPMELSAR